MSQALSAVRELLVLLVMVAGCLLLASQVSADSAPSGHPDKLTVAAIQFRSSRNLADNVKRLVQFLARAHKAGAQVAVFPECATTGYFADTCANTPEAQLRKAANELAAACKANKIYAVIGSPWRQDGKLYNSALIFTPEGKLLERYDKVQLAEGWPVPGEHLSVYPIAGVLCSTIICHDERYPELVRLPVLAGAQVIFYLSSESGLHAESKLGPYRAQIQARAVENNVFVVQANTPANYDCSGSHGQSRLIAPDGNIIEEASFFGEDMLVATFDLRRANRGNALRSLSSPLLGDWWRQGLQLVKHVQ